jgi:hypothetical protein
MKIFTRSIALTFLVLSSLAFADTSLLEPVAHFSPICGGARVNEQTITAFDGTTATVEAHGYTACGHSGHGGISYVYWCKSLTFNLNGELLSEVEILPSTSQGFNNCPWADPSLSFIVGSYRAYTEILIYNATLTSPFLAVN